VKKNKSANKKIRGHKELQEEVVKYKMLMILVFEAHLEITDKKGQIEGIEEISQIIKILKCRFKILKSRS